MPRTTRPLSSRSVSEDSAVVAAQCARCLCELRQSTGETQKQFAERIGMTESMISRLEKGDHMPMLATLSRIAAGFGRRIEIVFHAHDHEHADGTRHSHRHGHGDLDHHNQHALTAASSSSGLSSQRKVRGKSACDV
ncbi:helix-turn-helix domain-containing protein [Novosphingobium panipatense]|uniref:Helix-turn-helix domain-containing protein n=1 Tax=Sphingobium yanoikuyae TaxID=13690 RepID=A0A3G2UR93_SPHYA|nr:helix-turn-helix transcriptional regulator [Sphingobium yanoikuyae]AYO75489.1 helix-turn-helix domain-containing protein [Sphingobium yanoikuyae]MDG2515833.1 helix-turn-helix domain-containing protein [Sphingobium yanoikuyae]QNG49762.1 helix-turn-helix domain-containing protein [Sphingobium yanoikuyae]